MRITRFTTWLLALLLLILPLSPVGAQQTAPDFGADPPDQNQEESTGSGPGPISGQPIACDGYRDWSTFISSTISYDGFVEYWDDILVRYNTNICHYTDIDGLLKRITKVRKQIRNAFYACADTTQMKKTYYELEAELFFLRNYIDTENGSFIVVSDEKVTNDMRDFFVLNKGFFTDQEILELVDRFKARYSGKLKTYQNCTDPTWGALVEKWNQFKEDAGGIAPAVSQAKESFEKRWDRVEKTPWRRGDDFFGDFVDVRVNGLPAKDGFAQIGEALEESLPEGYTFEQLEAAKVESDKLYNYQAQEQLYLAQYQAQYSESSDQLTKNVLARLALLQNIITETFPYQNQTIQCTKSINDKQC